MKKGTRYVECVVCESCNVSTVMHTHEGQTFCGGCSKLLTTRLASGVGFDEAVNLACQDYVKALKARSGATKT